MIMTMIIMGMGTLMARGMGTGMVTGTGITTATITTRRRTWGGRSPSGWR